MHELGEQEIQSLYTWIDEIPLSRPKKNISRDFSDGVACAEVVHHFVPKFVDLHNYSPANSVSQKIYNWTTLNQKVFRRIGYSVSDDIIQCIVNNKPGYIEYLLFELRQKITLYLERKSKSTSQHLHPTQPNFHHPGAHLGSSHSGAASTEPSRVPRQMQPGISPHQPVFVSHPSLAQLPAPDKDMMHDLQDTINILQLKITKLEQLLTLKDQRIQELSRGSWQ
ncbi:hypothetical protein HK105_204709 [Polyrhizophydium stewartii]|uniref:Calponin-homology (CH) domain-containing protein n=1 Tax=Polyrhizophydium stewartii TaxID=2732419 RepID=A0ABR4N8D3_9FUNG